MLKILLKNLIKKGTLRVIHANGSKKIYQGKEPGPDITVKIPAKKISKGSF